MVDAAIAIVSFAVVAVAGVFALAFAWWALIGVAYGASVAWTGALKALGIDTPDA